MLTEWTCLSERVKRCNAVCVLQNRTVTPCVIGVLTYKRSAFCIDMRDITLDVLAEQVSGVVVTEACNAVHAVQVVQPRRCAADCSAFCNKVSVIIVIGYGHVVGSLGCTHSVHVVGVFCNKFAVSVVTI